MSNRYFQMSSNDMMTAILASSKLPLNPKTKVYDETEEPKKISGNIFSEIKFERYKILKIIKWRRRDYKGFFYERREYRQIDKVFMDSIYIT